LFPSFLLLGTKAQAVEQYDMPVKSQNQLPEKRQIKLTEKLKEDSQGKLLRYFLYHLKKGKTLTCMV